MALFLNYQSSVKNMHVKALIRSSYIEKWGICSRSGLNLKVMFCAVSCNIPRCFDQCVVSSSQLLTQQIWDDVWAFLFPQPQLLPLYLCRYQRHVWHIRVEFTFSFPGTLSFCFFFLLSHHVGIFVCTDNNEPAVVALRWYTNRDKVWKRIERVSDHLRVADSDATLESFAS